MGLMENNKAQAKNMQEYIECRRSDNNAISLKGRINSFNAPMAEKALNDLCRETQDVILDCEELEYTASSGLRIFLAMSKKHRMTLVNVQPAVYEVLELSGLTSIMDVHKAFRIVSLEGCEVIGEGANGIVYRLDPETVIKVFRQKDALLDIERERNLARTALILGIPTAIAYDTVRVPDGRYGAVYEMLASKSYAKLLKAKEKTVDEIADMSVQLLRIIHAAEAQPEVLPSMKQIALGRVEEIRPYLSTGECERLKSFIDSLADSRHLLHGDFHIKNVHWNDGESILLDMFTLCTGDPLFELAGVYYTYRSFADLDPDNAVGFLGITPQEAFGLCDQIIEKYYADRSEQPAAAYDGIRLIAYCRLLRFTLKASHYDSQFREKQIRHCQKMISVYLDRIYGTQQEDS